jgi:predicted amidohydrolase YtcJ
MTNYTRREFLESGAMLAAALGVDVGRLSDRTAPQRAKTTSRDPGPDLVVLNARVYTMDDALPRAEALAARHGRFIAVGSTDDVRNLVTRDTEVIDAAGMTVLPGFIDAHSHPNGVRELTGVNVNLRTVGEVKAVLRAKAAQTPPGYWVSGYMYDDTKLDRPVTRRDLDDAVPNHPAMVGHRGGHTGVYNSRAFELAGVSADTPDPPGGKFYRENGELTGKVAERARRVFEDIGKREPVTRETRRQGSIGRQVRRRGS